MLKIILTIIRFRYNYCSVVTANGANGFNHLWSRNVEDETTDIANKSKKYPNEYKGVPKRLKGLTRDNEQKQGELLFP